MDSPTDQVNLVTVTRRERNRLAVTKYRQTEAGKAAMARYVNKRRERIAAAKLSAGTTCSSCPPDPSPESEEIKLA